MFLNVRDIEVRPLVFHREFPIGEIDFLDEKLRQASALTVEGRADYSQALREIRLSGHLRVEMETECDRCLESFRFPIDTDFRLTYQPEDANVATEEAGLNDEEAELAFYEGDGLELTDVFREQILLAIPMQRTCGEDCQGLCPSCGENWNFRECDCEPVGIDERLSALRAWKPAL